MIVVEGCDGTGKTTLVNRLSDELSLSIGVRGTRNRDELYKVTREDTYRAISHAVAGHEMPYIWDRLGPFSDPIYSRCNVPRRESAFSVEEMRHCTEVMKALRCPIIICHVPLETARENAMMGHQMKGVDEHFDQIWGLYERLKDALVEWGQGHVYDYRKGEVAYKDVKDQIQTYLARRRVREWR